MFSRLSRILRLTRFHVAEDSMAPVLRAGDRLLVRPWREPARRGEIAVYRAEGGYLVKRIVGLGGEDVAIAGGVIFINGRVWDDPWWGAATRPDGEWRIPPGTCFTLGDNRPRSAGDSRAAGPVAVSDMAGAVVFRYWPLRRMARFRRNGGGMGGGSL